MKPVILIPLFNHANTVRSVVLSAMEEGFQCIVVDDGSTDAGVDALSDTGCAMVRFRQNRGKGAAILAGARQARSMGFDAVITVDADGQHDPADARLLIEAARDSMPCVVIGERAGMDHPNVPASSRFGKKFSNFWVRLECGVELPDTQSGFRLYPVELLTSIPFRARRYDFEIEVIVRAAWAGLEIKSVPVTVHYPDRASRISHFHKFADNLRLALSHARLVSRALLPFGHKRLVETTKEEPKLEAVKHPVRFFWQLCKEHSSPAMLAAAVWTGLFLGALPLIACHTVVIIYVAHRLNMNKVAAVGASQFCCPPVVPVLCVECGYFMRHGTFLTDAGLETLVLQVHQRLWEWFLGSLVIGPVLGAVGATAVYLVAVYQRNRGCEPAE